MAQLFAALLVVKYFQQVLLVVCSFVPNWPCTSIPCAGTLLFRIELSECTSYNGLVIVLVANCTGNIKNCCFESYDSNYYRVSTST